MSRAPKPEPRLLPAIVAVVWVCVLFFMSGTIGLVYEVVWKHLFGTVFGNTTYAVAVVVSVFMAGLALGSLVFGRVADRTRRHLIVFAFLQLGIAASGALVPWALAGAEGLYRAVYRGTESAAVLTAVQVIVSAAVLLVPTFLMGGTLPVLSRFVAARRGRVAPAVGLLYGLNTLGAAVGAFLSGYVLIKAIGTLNTTYVAAGANVGLAGAFALVHFLWPPVQQEAGQRPAEPQEEPAPGRTWLIALAIAISGFVSFSYEVLWTRLLTFHLEATVYAFSTMLTTFLLGLGLGAAVVGMLRRTPAREHYWRIFGYLEACIGLFGLGSVLLFCMARRGYASLLDRMLSSFATSALIMLVPAILMGAAFPIACHLYAQGVERTGRSVGRIYLFNTVGAVLGSLLTAFWLVRALGTQGSLTLVSFLIVASGTAVLVGAPRAAGAPARPWRTRGSVAALWAVAAALALLTPSDYLQQYFVKNQSVRVISPDSKVTLLGYEEGVEGVVVACEAVSPDGLVRYKTISAGSTDVAGTSYLLRNTQKLQAHVPMLLHPRPKEVCQVGFGSGETARIFASYDVDRFDCVEISPAMLRLADRYFRDINGGVLASPKMNVIIMDAAAFLKYTDRTYDVIANDATWPSQAGPAMLFTLEYFQDAKARLNPGGIMTSWLPISMPRRDLKTILRTFHKVFEHVYIWTVANHMNRHALIVGSEEPIQVDAARFIKRFNRFAREDLKSVYLDNPAVFLSCDTAVVEGAAKGLDDAPLSTVHRPVLKFMYSRLYDAVAMQGDAYRLLATYRDSILRHLTNLDGEGVPVDLAENIRRLDKANDHILAALMQPRDQSARRDAEMQAAIQLAPEHPATILLARSDQALASVSSETLRTADLRTLKGLALKLLRAARYDRAELALREWIRREPESASARATLGSCYMRTGRLDEAIEALTEAVRLDPDAPQARFDLGVAYVLKGEPARALDHLMEAVRLAPGSARAHAYLGTAYALTGNNEAALRHLSSAVQLDPSLPDARRNLGALLLRMGRADEAVRQLEAAARLQPRNPQNHRLLAKAYRAAGNEAAAARESARARQLQPNAPPKP